MGGRKMKKLISIFAIVVLVFIISGCGSKQDPLVGKWVEDAESGEVLELFSDGTGILTTSEGSAYSLTSWIAENGRLKITSQMPLVGEYTVAFDYELNGKVLTVIIEGESTTYQKEE